MKSAIRLAWMVLAFWLFADVAAASFFVPARPPNYRRSTFSQAPRAVQDYLLKSMAVCGVAPNIVRPNANFEVEPISGAGRSDYYFVPVDPYWSGPTDFEAEKMCRQDFGWSMLSMDLGNGRYKTFDIEYTNLYFKRARWLLFQEDENFHCPGRAGFRLHAYGRLTVWDRTAAAFRPVTGCITLERAFIWATDRGYRQDDQGVPP